MTTKTAPRPTVTDRLHHLPRPPRATPAGSTLDDKLARWVRNGLLSEQQARAIAMHERVAGAAPPSLPSSGIRPAGAPPRAERKRRVPPVAEALGYIGGVLAVVGLGLLIGRSWNDMSIVLRAVVTGGGGIALIAAGAFVHEAADPALARLRALLWLLGTGATTVSAGVLVRDGLDVERGAAVAIACSATAAVFSAALWQWRRRPVQQFTCLAATVVLGGTAAYELFDSASGTGLAIWIVGVAMLAIGLRKLTPQPIVATLVGAVAAVIAGVFVNSVWQATGLTMIIVTAFGLLALALVPGITTAPTTAQQAVLAGVGAVALFQATPTTLAHFAHSAGLLTGLVVWLIGVALMVVGDRGHIRLPIVAEAVGGIAVVGGAALTGVQYAGLAPLFGIATALALIGLGTIPGRVLYSMIGSLGMLINVPWAIGHYFPGAGRAPLLIMVSGALIIAVAVLMTRLGGRMRTELGRTRGR